MLLLHKKLIVMRCSYSINALLKEYFLIVEQLLIDRTMSQSMQFFHRHKEATKISSRLHSSMKNRVKNHLHL